MKTDQNYSDKASKIEFHKRDYSLKMNNLLVLDNNNLNLNKDNTNNEIYKNEKIKLNDYELNLLDYQSALKLDKRPYIEYYFSLLRKKQLLIFTFYTYNDYNSKIIKFILFLFSFSLYLTVDALFFGDSTMPKIYQDEGEFNFIYQLPQIIYSTCISSVINLIAITLSLSERNIIQLKKETNDIQNKIILVLKKIKVKIIFFFVIIFSLLVLFWYYISCFCTVYKNTQIHLIKDTLISFGLYLMYPFGLELIPGIFRIPALKAANKNRECLYKISKIIQLI